MFAVCDEADEADEGTACSVSSSGRLPLASQHLLLQEVLMLPGPWSGLTVASSSKHLWGFSLPLTLSPHGEKSPVSILDHPWPKNLLPHLTCVASRCCDLNWAPSSARIILAFRYTGEPSCQVSLLRFCELQLSVFTGLSFLLLFHHAREKKTIEKWKVVYPFHISYPIMKEVLFWSRFEGRRCHIVTSLQID